MLFASSSSLAQTSLANKPRPPTEWPPIERLKFPDHYYKRCLGKIDDGWFKDRDEPIRKLLVEKTCACFRDATLEVGFKKLGARSTETRVAYWMGLQERKLEKIQEYIGIKCSDEKSKFIKDVLGASYFTEEELFTLRVNACREYNQGAYAERVKKNPKLTQEIFVHFCVCDTNQIISHLRSKDSGLTRKAALVALSQPDSIRDRTEFGQIQERCWNEAARSLRNSSGE